MTRRSKFLLKKTRTFRSRFVVYCWCADWHVGQGSREYRLLCRLQFWFRVEFGRNVRWRDYYERNYERARSTKLYKELVAKYINAAKKPKAEEDFVNELFQLLKQTCHNTVRFCNWTLNLDEKRSYPPCGLKGYCPTVYRDHDLSNDEDLHYICKDFVKIALHSRQHQKEEVSTEFITAINNDMEG